MKMIARNYMVFHYNENNSKEGVIFETSLIAKKVYVETSCEKTNNASDNGFKEQIF